VKHRDGLPELCAVPQHARQRQHPVPTEDETCELAEIEWKVAEAAKLFNIYDAIEKHVVGISGGQKAECSPERAMVRDPAFLLGEPLATCGRKD
jgi:ABC-type sugar transport system ATPase subunit